MGIEGIYLNLIKAVYDDKLTTNIILNGEKLKTSPLKEEKGAHSHHYYST